MGFGAMTGRTDSDLTLPITDFHRLSLPLSFGLFSRKSTSSNTSGSHYHNFQSHRKLALAGSMCSCTNRETEAQGGQAPCLGSLSKLVIQVSARMSATPKPCTPVVYPVKNHPLSAYFLCRYP